MKLQIKIKKYLQIYREKYSSYAVAPFGRAQQFALIFFDAITLQALLRLHFEQ